MIGIIEVGNTCLKTAVWSEDKIGSFRRLGLQVDIKKAINLGPSVDTVILAGSGSAEVQALVVETLAPQIDKIIVLNKKGSLPFKSQYADGQAGIDRLANIAACISSGIFPVVIVDAGSAITVDVVAGEPEFLGGVIMPGLRMQGEALNTGTATLPLVQYGEECPAIIGTNTNEAIRAGILFGTCGAIKHLITKAKENLSVDCPTILTGGDSGLMSRICQIPESIIDESLTLRGLVQIAIHQHPELLP